MSRRAALAKLHIACKELALDEAAYRLMLERVTGHASAADCTDAQLAAVLDELKAKGWTPKVVAGGRTAPAPRPRRADHPAARKARALWISLHQLGVARDPSERALEAFGRRQLGVDRLHWADQAAMFGLIEALKAMAERAGWSQDVSGVAAADQVAVLKRRLAEAIARRKAPAA